MRYLTQLTIKGYRGFRREQTAVFAVPDGKPASGLTVITGPNNAGKSSVLEAIRALGARQQPSFGRAQRNARARKVNISYSFEDNSTHALTSTSSMSHSTEWSTGPQAPLRERVYFVPAARDVTPYFGQTMMSRRDYSTQTVELRAKRNEPVDLNGVLMRIEADSSLKKPFDKQVSSLLGFQVKWGIEKIENEQYVFSIASPTGSHTSDGIGYGVLSVFYIVAGMLESAESDIICIDEPETSMHPQVQKRVAKYLSNFADGVQIVVATHSPYFVDPTWFRTGAELMRCFVGRDTTQIGRLSASTKADLVRLATDLNNPHTLGLDAREVFFVSGTRRVLVVEGQEDVMILNQLLSREDINVDLEVFGWGAGGAEKIEMIVQALMDLGITDIATLVDGDKADLHKKLSLRFPNLSHYILPTDDIRDKPARRQISAKVGVCDSKGTLKEKYESQVVGLLNELGS